MLDNIYMPAIRTGEPITHFLYRLFPYICEETKKLLIQTLNGHPNATIPVWLRPWNLDGIARILGPRWSGRVLRQKHTLAPLINVFLNEKVAAAFSAMVDSGERHPTYSNERAMHGPMLWGLAYCSLCVKNGSAGVPLVKRAHLLSGLSVCHLHGEELLTFCDVCTRRYKKTRSKLLMRDKCVCGEPLRPRFEGLVDAEREKDMMFGRVTRSLLNCEMTTQLGTRLAIGMQRKATELGLLELKSRSRLLQEFLFDTWGAAFVHRHGLDFTTRSLVYKRLYHGEPVGHVVAGIGLVLSLFGPEFSLDQLVDGGKAIAPAMPKKGRQDWEDDAEKTGIVTLGTRAFTIDEFTTYCRERLAAKMARYPGVTRSEVLVRLDPRVQRWLRAHDTEYLSTLLPVRHVAGPEYRPRGLFTEAEDATLAIHMRKQHQALLRQQKDRPCRISVSLLIGGHPLADNVKWDHPSIPRARAVRAELEETRSQYRQRLLCRHWIRNGKYREKEAAEEKIRQLTDDEVRRAIQVANVVRKNRERRGK